MRTALLLAFFPALCAVQDLPPPVVADLQGLVADLEALGVEVHSSPKPAIRAASAAAARTRAPCS